MIMLLSISEFDFGKGIYVAIGRSIYNSEPVTGYIKVRVKYTLVAYLAIHNDTFFCDRCGLDIIPVDAINAGIRCVGYVAGLYFE